MTGLYSEESNKVVMIPEEMEDFMLRLFSIMYFCMCKVTIRIEFVRSVSILSITYFLRNMIDFIRDNRPRVHNKSAYSALSKRKQ